MHHEATSPPLGGYTTLNTVAVLERLARGPCSAPEVAGSIGVDVRTARRVLTRLEASGYAVQDGGHRRRYRATLRIVGVASAVLAASPIPGAAAGRLAGLARSTGGTAHLWVTGSAGVCCLAHAGGEAGAAVGVCADEPLTETGSALHALAARGARRVMTFVDSDGATTSTVGIVDRNRTVAAVGVTDGRGVEDLADIRAAVAEIEKSLSGLSR